MHTTGAANCSYSLDWRGKWKRKHPTSPDPVQARVVGKMEEEAPDLSEHQRLLRRRALAHGRPSAVDVGRAA